jgi:hypothetical protein
MSSKWKCSEDAAPGDYESHTVRLLVSHCVLPKLTELSLQLFKITKNIFLPGQIDSVTTAAFTLSRGIHSFPFEIQFPGFPEFQKMDQGKSPLQAVLPPSFTFKAPKLEGSAKVRYWLSVRVKKSCRLKSNLLQKQELRFEPFNPFLSPARLGSIKVTRNGRLGSLQMTLPSPVILNDSLKLPLLLSFKSQKATIQDSSPLVVRSLKIAILMRTTILLPCSSATWTESRDLIDMTGLEARINDTGQFEALHSGLYQNTLTPEITPSFITSTVRRSHSLVVTVGFSYGCGGFIHVRVMTLTSSIDANFSQTIEAGVDVEVHTSMPLPPSITSVVEMQDHPGNGPTDSAD